MGYSDRTPMSPLYATKGSIKALPMTLLEKVGKNQYFPGFYCESTNNRYSLLTTNRRTLFMVACKCFRIIH